MAILALWFGLGAETRTDASLVINTPAGLTAGDTFRIVFLTDGGTTATSTSITDYDNFVTSQAGGATYNGVTVTWQAIASTSTVNAIDHLGVNPGISGVYLANGLQVATGDGTGTAGLWSGQSQIQLTWISRATSSDGHSLDGNDSHRRRGSDGPGQSGPLGTSSPTLGWTSPAFGNWIDAGNFPSSPGVNVAFYGMSEVLTVPNPSSVPEPSSLIMAATGSTFGLVLVWSRKRK